MEQGASTSTVLCVPTCSEVVLSRFLYWTDKADGHGERVTKGRFDGESLDVVATTR